jgi:hypothetical protein
MEVVIGLGGLDEGEFAFAHDGPLRGLARSAEGLVVRAARGGALDVPTTFGGGDANHAREEQGLTHFRIFCVARHEMNARCLEPYPRCANSLPAPRQNLKF